MASCCAVSLPLECIIIHQRELASSSNGCPFPFKHKLKNTGFFLFQKKKKEEHSGITHLCAFSLLPLI